MQKFTFPLLVAFGLVGCQSQAIRPISQTKPIVIEKEPLICTMQYDPVCVTSTSNGVTTQKTYGNSCTAKIAENVVNVSQGQCGNSVAN